MTTAPTHPSAYSASALPPGTRLGEFEVLGVLGVGGFGIVYLALDHALEREVAIKEYMPATLAGRTETLHVTLRSQSDADVFALGLQSFVKEARLLARFNHPSLLKVYRFWEANDTAYMSMPVYRGHTLKKVRAAMSGAPDEAWLRKLLMPLLGAIEILHRQEVYHRDIAPDNILIEADGRPVLLDFGAARRVIGDRSQNLTAILKPAYAPIEQYAEATSVRQGPWTDLYALGATMYFALAGHPPVPSTARTLHDDMAPLATMHLPGCSSGLLRSIDWMLAPRPADRPQSVAELRTALDGTAEPAPRLGSATVAPEPPPMQPEHSLAAETVAKPSAPPLSIEDRTTRVDPPFAPPPPAAAPDLELDFIPEPLPPEPVASQWERRRPIDPVLAGVLVLGLAGAWWMWPSAPEPDSRVQKPPPVLTSPSTGLAPPTKPADPITVTAPPPVMAKPAQVEPARPQVVAKPAPPEQDRTPPAPTGQASPSTTAASPDLGSAVVTSVPAPAPSGLARPLAGTALPLPAMGSEGLPASAAAAAPTTVPPLVPPPKAVPAPVPVPVSVPATATATAPAAASAALPLSDDPEAICGRRVLLALFLCMETECRTDQFANHPACRKWRQQSQAPRP